MNIPYTLAVISAVAVLWLALIVYGRITRKTPSNPTCPECGGELSQIRTPVSMKQVIWGGWTCSKCGGHIDRWGLRI